MSEHELTEEEKMVIGTEMSHDQDEEEMKQAVKFGNKPELKQAVSMGTAKNGKNEKKYLVLLEFLPDEDGDMFMSTYKFCDSRQGALEYIETNIGIIDLDKSIIILEGRVLNETNKVNLLRFLAYCYEENFIVSDEFRDTVLQLILDKRDK